MREVSISTSDLDGCCAVEVLFDFPIYEGFDYEDSKPMDGVFTDEEWFSALFNSLEDSRPLKIFTHAVNSNSGPCTPAKLAKWLRTKGEKVSTGSSAVNPRSKNNITIYTWAPSKAFYKKFHNSINKKNKKDAADAARGTRAA